MNTSTSLGIRAYSCSHSDITRILPFHSSLPSGLTRVEDLLSVRDDDDDDDGRRDESADHQAKTIIAVVFVIMTPMMMELKAVLIALICDYQLMVMS
jgi:hypothetical protein